MKRSYVYMIEGVRSWRDCGEVDQIAGRKRARAAASLLDNNRLTLLDTDLLALILSFMPNDSLQTFCHFLFELLSIDPQKACTTYCPLQQRYLTLLQMRIKTNRTIMAYADEMRINQIHCCEMLRSTGGMENGWTAPASERLDAMRLVLATPFFDVIVFLNCAICEQCGEGLTHRYVTTVMSLPFLCKPCQRAMDETGLEEEYKYEAGGKGYVWIKSKDMKRLCGISQKQKAEDYATVHHIRSTTMKGKNKHYLLKDMEPLIKRQ